MAVLHFIYRLLHFLCNNPKKLRGLVVRKKRLMLEEGKIHKRERRKNRSVAALSGVFVIMKCLLDLIWCFVHALQFTSRVQMTEDEMVLHFFQFDGDSTTAVLFLLC